MIFLVDDDPIQNMLTSKLIETHVEGTKYKIFNNGKEVLDHMDTGESPKIILLDINMPVMNGWEFLDVYELFDNKAKVFMLTSSTNEDDLKQSEVYQCVEGYFSKPINVETIKEMLLHNNLLR